MESEEGILFTPLENLAKDDASLINVSGNRSHLKVNGVIRFYIVK